jgi:hypothetical protein
MMKSCRQGEPLILIDGIRSLAGQHCRYNNQPAALTILRQLHHAIAADTAYMQSYQHPASVNEAA